MIPAISHGHTKVKPPSAAVTADYCPACSESILGVVETNRVMGEVAAFAKQVDAARRARATS